MSEQVPAGLRIALVGPTHPFKGGVAAHTTQTAHELAAAGHEVELVSWERLYPQRLYPGRQTVPEGAPDLPPFEPTVRPLRWDRPLSWLRTGRRLRSFDLVVVVVVVPVQVPALLTLVRALRTGRRGRVGTAGVTGTAAAAGSVGAAATAGSAGAAKSARAAGPRVLAIAHNVVPHETHPGGEWLVRRMLRAVDGVVVHSAEQGRLAEGLGVSRLRVAPLAPHLPGGLPVPSGRSRALARPAPEGPVRVLALGIVRDYKGFDLLLTAAREVEGVRVTVAGELWGTAGERVRRLAADPALAGRVELRPGYLPGVEIPDLLAAHDVMALPYRHATASQNALLAQAHGMPVLATRVGTFGQEVRDGVDGVLVPPGDVPELVTALRRLAWPGELERLRNGLPDLDVEKPWAEYVEALTQEFERPGS